MKNGIKMSIAALISSVAVLSAAVPASAAESSGKSRADAVKDVVLLWQSPAEGSDVNGDGEINVLDLMRYKYNIINPVTEPETAAGKFVYGLYRNMLGKDPDPAVAEDYAKQLESGDLLTLEAASPSVQKDIREGKLPRDKKSGALELRV